jgi:phosphonoacetaldehyde hydrolase
VKVDDTTVGVEEGLNAGMWSVGLAKSGNMIGLSEVEFNALEPAEQTALLASARERMAASGAHFVIDSVAELPAVLDRIEALLAQGRTP